MQQLLALAGNIAALVGIALCAISGLARLAGQYHLAGFENTTLFLAGVGLMVFACLLKLQVLEAHTGNR